MRAGFFRRTGIFVRRFVMEYVIETFSLTKIFSDWWGRNKVCAVEDLNLKIRKNEVFGLLGPNGSGKTTTIKLLLRLLYPTRGRAIVLGGDSCEPKISARIGFLPEESYLYRYLSARETLDFYGRLFSLSAKVRKMRIEALLDMVGLRAAANRPVGTFSKGMARRIGLAQALINDPDLLILDEPTTGLDPIGTRQIKDLVLTLAKRGKTILLCSHLLADVEDVCDRIAILYGGKIQIEGKVKELLLQSNKTQITTGVMSEDTLEKVKELIEAEQTNYSVDTPMEKLETFFVETVIDAQSRALSTSGAVSTTQIGEFLSAEAGDGKAASILDKLVSKKEVEEAAVSEGAASEAVTSADESREKVDEQLLSKLSRPVEPAELKPVTEAPDLEQEPQEQEQIEKNILEQLTGDDLNTEEDDKRQAEEQQGESTDA